MVQLLQKSRTRRRRRMAAVEQVVICANCCFRIKLHLSRPALLVAEQQIKKGNKNAPPQLPFCSSYCLPTKIKSIAPLFRLSASLSPLRFAHLPMEIELGPGSPKLLTVFRLAIEKQQKINYRGILSYIRCNYYYVKKFLSSPTFLHAKQVTSLSVSVARFSTNRCTVHQLWVAHYILHIHLSTYVFADANFTHKKTQQHATTSLLYEF